VDTTPDFREQALRINLEKVDGIILTHMHFDHTAGIDDTRVYVFQHKPPIPLLLSKESYDEFMVRYHYFFQERAVVTAKVDPIILEHFPQRRTFLGIEFEFVTYFQGKMGVIGFKVGDFAYITDIKTYDESIFDSLQGVNTLVISALKEEVTPFHLSFKESIDFAKRVHAKKTYLTHLSHDVNYLNNYPNFPSSVEFAYDGLKIEFSYERKTD